MATSTALYATQLRLELAARNRSYARGRAHVESYGSAPVIVYEPDAGRHGNFFDSAYAAILARPEWMRRFDKIHAQAARSLPKPQSDLTRRWRELDSSMSSDALLMNIFCTPGVAESLAVRATLGVEDGAEPIFGWKARVPLANGRFDRTEVDLRFGSLLVEAKLTEADFQSRPQRSLNRIAISMKSSIASGCRALRSPPSAGCAPASFLKTPHRNWRASSSTPISIRPRLCSYQLIRNVLAAMPLDSSFCVIHDERRPDLREAWFEVMAAVKSAELARASEGAHLAGAGRSASRCALQEFLDRKYGIVAPGKTPRRLRERPTSRIDAAALPYSPRIFRFRCASAPPPAKSSKARSVTRIIWSRTNFAPSAAPTSGCFRQHSHSTTAQPG
jgi:hypothetical protein